MRQLMPQQVKAFEYAKPLKQIALFMEMRLGKTMVTIRWAEHHKLRKILVLTPDAVKPSWISELQKERIADEDIVDLKGSPNKRLDLASGRATWNIITHQSVESDPRILELKWDGIVNDESTLARNPKANITKYLRKKKNNFKFRAILSGLPDPESVLDYYEQLAFCFGEFMGCANYWEFRRRYFRPTGFNGYSWECSKKTEQRIKDEVGKIAFVMTRKQAGIGSIKLRTTLVVELNKAQKDMLKQIEQGFEIGPVEKSDYGEDTKWVPVTVNWEAMIAGGFSPHGILLSNAKTLQIIRLMRGELKNEKVVIWFRFNHELKHVAAELNKANIKAVSFTGEDKSQAVQFTHGKARVICAQGRCGRYGLDWSISSTAGYYSNWFDGEVRAQSEDRVIHPKKKEPTLLFDLVTKDSIDEHVVAILKQKKLRSKKFLEELARRRACA